LGWSSTATGPFVNNAGGHFIVLCGFDGTEVDVDDPEPFTGAFMEDYTTLLGGRAGTYRTGAPRFMWTHSLVPAGSIDVVIQIDTTGSMGDEIAAVVPEATQIVQNIFATYPNARVAVVDYKDNPDYSGDDYNPDDYIAYTDQPFTTDINAVINAINSLEDNVTGGGDLPEAVYSALYNTLEGGASQAGEYQTQDDVLTTSIGGWRPDPVKRIIIDMGDAGGHDPVEPWANGHSIADVVSLASALGIEIDTIPCAVDFGSYYDPQCLADFGALSAGSGGVSLAAGSGVEVVANIPTIIQESTASRSPSGVVRSFKPEFQFSFDGTGMLNPPTYYEIQILHSNAHTTNFSLYLSAKVTTNSYTPTSPLPTNSYEWRVGFAQPATTVLAPNGTVLHRYPATISYDNQYVQFDRVQILPAAAETLTPSVSSPTTDVIAIAPSFTATNSTMTYSWTAGLNASSYSVAIYSYSTKTFRYSLWKRLTVSPPAKTPNAPTLSVKVSGHTKNATYEWTVESLNYDHPKPTSTEE
jgi:hypothetical protein